jgi:hypothetical protein
MLLGYQTVSALYNNHVVIGTKTSKKVDEKLITILVQ